MKCFTPITLTAPKRSVPCGRCYACLHNKRVEWVIRLKEELKNGVRGHFVTLTYSDKYLPVSKGVSFVKKIDCQLFIKRLRKVVNIPLKYYLAAVYGENTHRPHYHAIIFCDLDRTEMTKAISTAWSKQFKNNNNEFSNIRESFGHIQVDPVNDNRIGYVCGYVMDSKKQAKSGKKVFALMSKGLGKNYLNNKELINWHKTDPLEHRYYAENKSKKRLPRYYWNKMFDKSAVEVLSGMAEKQARKEYTEMTVEEITEEWRKWQNKVKNSESRRIRKLKERQL